MGKKNSSELKEYYTVCQANPLIEGFFRFSLLAKKVFLCAVSQIQPEDSDFKVYSFRISDFKEMAGIKGKDDYFIILRNAVKELRKESITVKRIDGKGRIDIPFAAVLIEDTSEKTVGLTFPKELKPYLLDLKNSGGFTKYSLGNIMKLKSVYSIRIYQLCKQYQNTSKKERIFEFAELKRMLGIDKNKSYPYGSFKQRVLDPAKKEIPKKTDIPFNYIPKKDGRKYRWITFTFGDEADFEDPKEIGLDISKDILDMIPTEYKTDLKLIKHLSKSSKEKGEAYVMKNIFYVIGKNPKKNFTRYLMLSIDNDWASGSSMTLPATGNGKPSANRSVKTKISLEEMMSYKNLFLSQLNDDDKFDRYLNMNDKDLAETEEFKSFLSKLKEISLTVL